MAFLVNEQSFVDTYFYNCVVNKQEILKSHGKNPVTQKIRTFKEYGKWQFQFWPDGYFSNNPKSYCIRLISINPKCLGTFCAKISIFISDGSGKWLTVYPLCRDQNVIQRVSKVIPAFGIICSKKSFLQDFPQTLEWEKIHFEIKCSFTTVENNNLINEQNWITLKLLQKYNIEKASFIFGSVNAKTKALNYFDVDAEIICKRKWFIFWKPKEVLIPIHKSKFVDQSVIFAETLSKNNSIKISSKFSVETVEKIILFCYQGYLKSYEKSVIQFAIKYQMKKLLSKTDLKYQKLISGNDEKIFILPKKADENLSNKKTNNPLKKLFISFLYFIKSLV